MRVRNPTHRAVSTFACRLCFSLQFSTFLHLHVASVLVWLSFSFRLLSLHLHLHVAWGCLSNTPGHPQLPPPLAALQGRGEPRGTILYYNDGGSGGGGDGEDAGSSRGEAEQATRPCKDGLYGFGHAGGSRNNGGGGGGGGAGQPGGIGSGLTDTYIYIYIHIYIYIYV